MIKPPQIAAEMDASTDKNQPRIRAPLPARSAEQDAALDAAILASASATPVKVAVLMAQATDMARARALDVSPGAIAVRIYALTEAGQLLVQGNVRRWRAAIVRLAP
jgi:hypothetical protein